MDSTNHPATADLAQNVGPHPLVAFRKERKLTQKALAALLEVARETVARWETGRKIDDDLLPRVAERTGISRGNLRPDLAALLAPEATQ